MSEIIPYEKDIKFDTKINEITSISLEHEEELKNEEIEGLFIISGDYKIHSISVNKEDFKYKIPFNIELSDSIDKESIKININDFTYDIIDSDTLRVKIELDFNYNIKEVEAVVEEKEDIDRQIEELITKEEIEPEVIQEEQVTIKEEKKEDTYVTYHVHIISDEDNIDTICLKYNIDKNTLHEYNDFEELKVNDKILIPIKDE